MNNPKLYGKSSLLKTAALLPLMTSCLQLTDSQSFDPMSMPREVYLEKARGFISRIDTPLFNFSDKRLLSDAFKTILSTEEGRQIFEKVPDDLRLIVADFSRSDIPYFQMFCDTKSTIVADNEFTSEENKMVLPLLLAHEMKHTIQPKMPKGLTLDQYATLYKLREIDSRMVEMQVMVDWDLDQRYEILSKPHREYASMYREKLDKRLKSGISDKRARELAKQETRSHFFKIYLRDDDSNRFIEPEWKKAYESHMIKSLLLTNMDFKKPEDQTQAEKNAYHNALDFYLKECGPFLHRWDINKTGINKENEDFEITKRAVNLLDTLKKSQDNYKDIPLKTAYTLAEKGYTEQNIKHPQNMKNVNTWLIQNRIVSEK